MNKVFAIPELVEGINQYLRPFERQQPSSLSRVFYNAFPPSLRLSLSSFSFPDPAASTTTAGPPTTQILSPDDIAALAPRTRVLRLEIHQYSSDGRQRALLDAVYRCWGSNSRLSGTIAAAGVRLGSGMLQELHIEYWGDNAATLKEVMTNLPDVRNVAVIFMASMRAMALPDVFIATSRTLD
ncbi:hypothetical protein EDD11_007538 [Mortierella claussenii]|nr:hypothetical protein EDD11_007538 [Mortierella claussenii]